MTSPLFSQNAVSSSATSHVRTPAEFSSSFSLQLKTANAEPDLVQKRILYNKAFKEVAGVIKTTQPITSEVALGLFQLLYQYASETCYAQKNPATNDSEEGFRHCARLLEMSLSLQLDWIDLGNLRVALKIEDLESLIQKLTDEHASGRGYFDKVSTSLLDTDYVLRNIDNESFRIQLRDTLIRLTFCYQNIAQLKVPSAQNYLLQRNLQTCAEKMIGYETPEQHKAFAEYAYNRRAFMIDMSGQGTPEAKAACYTELEELFKVALKDEPLILQSKLAQIKNMKGLLLRNGDLNEAEKYFREALELRLKLQNAFGTVKENADQEFLMMNVLTGLIHCLVSLPLTEERLAEAVSHAKTLEQYLAKITALQNNYHTYGDNYRLAVLKVTNAQKLALN